MSSNPRSPTVTVRPSRSASDRPRFVQRIFGWRSCQDAPQAMLGQQAGAFVDIAIEQDADAMPKRRDQAGPGLMEAGCELVSRAFWVGEQRRDQAVVVLVGYGFPAPGKLT